MTAFEAEVLRLFDQGKDTADIADILSKKQDRLIHESAVYRALNAARNERRIRDYMGGAA